MRRSRLVSAALTLSVVGSVACRSEMMTDPAGITPHPASDSGSSALHHPDGIVDRAIPLGGEPYGLAISSAGQVLVARVMVDSVSPMMVGDHAFATGISVATGSTVVCDTSSGQAMGTVHVAFNPAGTRAYVADQFGNALSVLDATAHTLIATVPLGDGGFNLGVAPNGGRVYATTAGGRVLVISTATNAIVDSMAVGSAANGVAFSPDGGTVYISSRDAGTVTAFRTSDDGLVRSYAVGGRPQRIAVSPDGATLYAANEDQGLDVVTLATGAVTTVSGLTTGYGLGETPDGAQLWVTSPLEGRVYIVDRQSLSPATVQLGTGVVPRNVAFSADGALGVVTDGNGSVIYLNRDGTLNRTLALDGEPYGVAISSAGQVFVARVIAGLVSPMMLSDPAFGTGISVAASTVSCQTTSAWVGSVHVAFNPAGSRAYVTDQFGNALSVLDAASHTLVATIPLGDGGFNLGVAPDGGRVYATTAGGHVLVISTADNQIVDSMRVGSASNGVAFSPDGKTVYISSRDAGTITAFRTDTDQPIATYTVGGQPQRLAVSPDGATLYAANESQGLDAVTIATGAVTTVSGLTAGYGLGETPDGAQLWVTSPLEGRVYIVDRATLTLGTTVELGGTVVPRNVAFTADGKQGVVTDGNGSVIFFH
ncbi:MAG TPA: YncE family protein [Gemmatimonadales bacterium]|jgi:YVTN family beta-propeller protein|nr:YncE family protein [Gemmatimonadales bacterium]